MSRSLKKIATVVVLSISISAHAAQECLNQYVELPPEVKAELDKQTVIAESMAKKANFIRVTDHDSQVKEVVYKSTAAIPQVDGKTISYQITHKFLNRTDGEAIAVPANLVEWMQPSDKSMILGTLGLKWSQLKGKTQSLTSSLEILGLRILELMGRGKGNTDNAPGFQITSDLRTSKAMRDSILSDIQSFDKKLNAYGLQTPKNTHIFVQQSQTEYGVKQVTAVELKIHDDSRPDDHDQYLSITNNAKKSVSTNEILRERMLSLLKVNYNHDGIVFKEENSFISTDATVSAAVADFMAAHHTGNPIVGERNIQLGLLSSGVKVENVKDLSRVGGTANSLLISKLLWDYRTQVGPEKMDLIIPRLIRNLSVLRSAFETLKLMPLTSGAAPYRYLRGSANDRSTSLQFEVDNLKFVLASFQLAHDETPGTMPEGKTVLQERAKFFGFVPSTNSIKERGAISGGKGITSNLVPLISPADQGKYPRLPVVAPAPTSLSE